MVGKPKANSTAKQKNVTVLSNVLIREADSPQAHRTNRIFQLARQGSTSAQPPIYPSSSQAPIHPSPSQSSRNQGSSLSNLLTRAADSPQAQRANRIFQLARQASSSSQPPIPPSPSQAPIHPSSSQSSRNQGSSLSNLLMRAADSPQAHRANRIFQLARQASVSSPQSSIHLPSSQTSSQPSSQPSINPSSRNNALEMLSKPELILLIHKKEDQVKNLQRGNKTKSMSILRKDKVIAQLQEKIKEQNTMNLLDDNFAEPFLSVVKDHIKNKGKPPTAHRFSNQTKSFAQVVHFLSPKVLRALRTQYHLCLPSESTISRFSCSWDFTNGFNPQILNPLQEMIKDLSAKEKVVCLTLDEMAIDTTIAYDKKNDKVLGLENRCENGYKMAKHVLCFMVQGIYRQFKQPLAYYTSQIDLNQETVTIITALQRIGLDVKVVVHDMGSNLLKTKKDLGITNESPYFNVNGKKVFFFADPPHLLKATRNMLFKNKLVDSETKEFATWDLIRAAFYADNQSEKLLPRLNQKAIQLTDNRDKMRVSYAAKTLSGTMAYALQRLLNEERIVDDAGQAPYLLKIIRTTNSLFDVFNSSARFLKTNKKPFTMSNEQMSVLSNANDLFKKMEVHQKYGRATNPNKRLKTEMQTGKKVHVQFIQQWQNNINALPLLFKDLQNEYGVEELPTKRVNQDCIENFFGHVRAKGGNCHRPNAMQFGYAFKKLVVTSMLTVSVGTNCEADFCNLIVGIQDRPENTAVLDPVTYKFVPDDVFFSKLRQWELHDEPNMILCGYFLRKLLEKHSCDECRDALVLNELTTNMVSKERECNTTLIWPTTSFARYVNVLTLCFDDHIMDNINEAKVVQRLTSILENIHFTNSPTCIDLQSAMPWFLKFFARTSIYFLLKEWKKDVTADKKLKCLSLRHFKDVPDTFDDVEYLEEELFEVNDDDEDEYELISIVDDFEDEPF